MHLKLDDTQFRPSLLRYGRFTGYFNGLDEKPVRWTKHICYDYRSNIIPKATAAYGLTVNSRLFPKGIFPFGNPVNALPAYHRTTVTSCVLTYAAPAISPTVIFSAIPHMHSRFTITLC